MGQIESAVKNHRIHRPRLRLGFERRLDLRDLLVLFVLVCCFFWKLAFTKQYTFLESPDLAWQVLPWLQVQATALRHGVVALWDPYLGGGQPLVGQLQPGVTNPLTYLLLAAPLRNGHIRLEFVHYWFVLIHCLGA